MGGSVALQRSWFAGIAAAVLAFPSLAASAATAVGDAASVVRLVSGELEGRKRPVRVGEKVFQNETIKTEQDSQALHVIAISAAINSFCAIDRVLYNTMSPCLPKLLKHLSVELMQQLRDATGIDLKEMFEEIDQYAEKENEEGHQEEEGYTGYPENN